MANVELCSNKLSIIYSEHTLDPMSSQSLCSCCKRNNVINKFRNQNQHQYQMFTKSNNNECSQNCDIGYFAISVLQKISQFAVNFNKIEGTRSRKMSGDEEVANKIMAPFVELKDRMMRDLSTIHEKLFEQESNEKTMQDRASELIRKINSNYDNKLLSHISHTCGDQQSLSMEGNNYLDLQNNLKKLEKPKNRQATHISRQFSNYSEDELRLGQIRDQLSGCVGLSLQQKQYTFQTVEKTVGRKVLLTKLIYSYPLIKEEKLDTFHKYVDNVPNFLVVIRLMNNHVCAAYSSTPYSPPTASSIAGNYQAVLFSITNQKEFQFQKSVGSRPLAYTKYTISFGSTDLRIRNEKAKKIAECRNNQFNYYGRNPDGKHREMLGHEQQEQQISCFEVFQLTFQPN